MQSCRLGKLELHPELGCLRQADGTEECIRQKSLAVLLFLIENRDRFVARDELLKNVWNGISVSENVLAQSINEIRKVLGDDSRHPVFIKTVPKLGYRFIGPIEPLEPEVVEAVSRPEPWHWKAPARIAAMSAILVLAAVLVIQRFSMVPRYWAEDSSPITKIQGKKTIAIVSFENQTKDQELAWLSDGLPDMLITDLSRAHELAVLARSPSAKRSRADVIVDGSFARLGTTTRINVQIHSPSDKRLIAAESMIASTPAEILTNVHLLSLKIAADLGAQINDGRPAETLTDLMTSNLKAYRFYSTGLRQAQAFHTAEAIDSFGKAVELDPQFAMAWARIGYTYAVTQGHNAQGKPYLEKAYKYVARLSDKDRRYIEGWYAVANFDFPAAIEAFRGLTAQYPYEVEAYLHAGLLLQGEERYDEAARILEQGLIIDSDSKDLYNALAKSYLAAGRRDEAIAMAQRYVALAPEESNAHDTLAMIEQRFGLYKEALAEYDRALELNPGFEIAVIHRGNVLYQTGRYAAAIREYEKYVTLAPGPNERARGYECIGLAWLKKGDASRARQAALLAMKEVASSALLLRLEVGLAPRDVLRQAVADAWVDRGQRGTARFRWYIEGQMAIREGQNSRALTMFQEALRHRIPAWNVEHLEDCVGNFLLTNGQWDAAISEYRRLLSVNPNEGRVRYSLARALEARGDRTEAAAEYRRFLASWAGADPDASEVVAAKKRIGMLG